MKVESKHLYGRQKLKNRPIEVLIEAARAAEERRDADSLHKILKPVWPDLDGEPILPDATPSETAELLRLCGFFLGYWGHLKNKPDYQERGKDILSAAIDLFESEGLEDEAARARLNLAWRYQQQGSHEEAAVILDYIKSQFQSRKRHPLYLCIQVFECVALISRGETNAAVRKIKKIERSVESCRDEPLRAQFHIEAGYVNTEKGDLESALRHYSKAVEAARAMNNNRFLAISIGNLAYVYKKKRDFAAAHEQIDLAIDLNQRSGNQGFLAHNYDTKAQIFFDAGEHGRALLAIENALKLFGEGDDLGGLADALCNKSKILFKLGETEQSLLVLSETIALAKEKISEAAALKYSSEYSALFFIPSGLGYKREVAEFRKHILRESLINAGLVMKDAAASLGISQAMLSDIVRRQFPELFDELGIKKRRSRKK